MTPDSSALRDPRPSATPVLSVIIPWCDRPEIAATLAHNRAQLSRRDREVIVVSCGGESGELRRLLEPLAWPGLRTVHVPTPVFNKGVALNLGVWAARAATLFLLDADIQLSPGLLGAASRVVSATRFVIVDRVIESQPRPGMRGGKLRELAHSVAFVDARGRRVAVETNRLRFNDPSRSGPGLVFLRRGHFLGIGGMNSDLLGWGWEDLDLLVRLQLGLQLRLRRLGRVVHLTHDAHKRARVPRGRRGGEFDNYVSCLTNYRNGILQGTYVRDVQRWSRRVRNMRGE